jgi:hypothetical protein
MIFPLRRKSPSILIKNMTVGMPFSGAPVTFNGDAPLQFPSGHESRIDPNHPLSPFFPVAFFDSIALILSNNI